MIEPEDSQVPFRILEGEISVISNTDIIFVLKNARHHGKIYLTNFRLFLKSNVCKK